MHISHWTSAPLNEDKEEGWRSNERVGKRHNFPDTAAARIFFFVLITRERGTNAFDLWASFFCFWFFFFPPTLPRITAVSILHYKEDELAPTTPSGLVSPTSDNPSSSTEAKAPHARASLSAFPVSSHASRSEARGKTARHIAARRRRMATWISFRHRCKIEEAGTRELPRVEATSAANFKVLVTAGWGRPSAVHTIGRKIIPAARSSWISLRYLRSFRDVCGFSKHLKAASRSSNSKNQLFALGTIWNVLSFQAQHLGNGTLVIYRYVYVYIYVY